MCLTALQHPGIVKQMEAILAEARVEAATPTAARTTPH
jgi:hypothetical protein